MTTPENGALRVAGQELAALADELPNPAWIADADGSIFWYNRAWHDYTGTAPGETLGWGWTALHHPDELERVLQIWTNAIAAGSAVELTFPLKGKDGRFRPFLTRVVPIRDSSGSVIRWFGTNVDISAQVAAEERLRDAERNWRNLFDEMQEGFYVLELTMDESGAAIASTIVRANRQIEAQLGLAPGKAVGRIVRASDSPEAAARLQIYVDVLRTGISQCFEGYLPEIGLYFEVRAYRHSPTRCAVLLTNLTARKLAEDGARRAQDNIVRISRLSAMGALASTLAHELNQPLGAAANYIAAANEHLKRSSDPERQRLQQLLKSASQSCLRAGQIIHSMREFTSTGRVTKTPEDLKEMISATIAAFLDDEASGGLMFEFVCPNGLPPIMCDRIQIEQVLINLYSNSMRAMATTEARLIRIDVTARPDVVLIRLGDSGPGLTDRSPEELFEPFWSTTDVGLGLGLPLCRTIVEAHGGAIWGERGDPDGACFVIRLPVDQGGP